MSTPTKYNDIIGKSFGRLTLLSVIPQHRKSPKCICECTCGTRKTLMLFNVLRGNTRSCGCFNKQATRDRSKTHGETGTSLYTVWKEMRYRCDNPNNSAYKWYGERGIVYDPSWSSYEVFREWAHSNGYCEGLTLDRENNNKNYEPNNCRWVTQKENNRNRRSSHFITINDETKLLSEWLKNPICTINKTTYYARIKYGWSIIDAIITPSKRTR